MSTLILHPTDTSQWYTLIHEAQASTRLVLNENTESYLVFLLMRFVRATEWLESIIAVDFLEALRVFGKQQLERLRELGDKCLLLAGMFPEVAKRRGVQLDYFTEMGQGAYLTVADMNCEQSTLYRELGHHFLPMQQILQAMQGNYFKFSSVDVSVVADVYPRMH